MTDPNEAKPPTLTIDGTAVSVTEGTTILSACAAIGVTIPTLCFLPTLKPVNVCRLCVVEIEGARVLAPSCSRAVEPGMNVLTRSPRVMLARRLVLELLASSVDLSTAPGLSDLLQEYGCRPERFEAAAADHAGHVGKTAADHAGHVGNAAAEHADHAGKAAAEHAEHAGEAAAEHADHAGKAAADHADHAGKAAADHAGHAGKTAAEHADHAGKAAAEHAEHAGEAAAEHADHAGKAVAEHADHAGKTAADHAGHAGKAAAEHADHAGKTAAEHADHARKTATVAQPVKIDNDLYVRDYSKCVLCYKCVEACGPDHQNTFAIAVAGRGFGAHISTEFAVELPDSACVYCGNCIAVCPTGALMASREYELRQSGGWDESRQTTTDTICPYCGVGCTLTLHVQDNEIVKATSPLDNAITAGNLCIKGRFGWRFVSAAANEPSK